MAALPYALAIGLLVSLGSGLVLGGVRKLVARGETAGQRLERLSASVHPLEEAQLEEPFTTRMLKPWIHSQLQALGRLAPSQNIERLRQNLTRAGHPYGLGVLDFLGLKLLSSVGVAIGALYLLRVGGASLSRMVPLSGALGVAGFILPDVLLRLRVGQRQAEIARTLPDALDMLTICVDAGAGLVSAMLRISQRWKNALGLEFGKAVAEINIGLTRREALQNVVSRTDVPDVRAFVAVLLQADQLGLSIASVLHAQADQMRVRRRQRAEEEARKIPIKMLFPLIFLTFPALLGVTLGPAIPILISIFAQLQGR
jgi:tight adherence protein C